MTAVRNAILTLLFAVLWMVLQDAYRVGSFVAGALVGALILLTFPTPVHGLIRPYVNRPGGFFRWLYHAAHLFLHYTWHWVKGNLAMARLMLRPNLNITPGVLKFPLRVHQPAQVALLANLITVTPGSFTVEVSDNYDTLYLHVIDASDPAAALAPIRRIEELIMEVLQ